MKPEKSLWSTYSAELIDKTNRFCENYKAFMSKNKTERECVTAMTEEAQDHGYVSVEDCLRAGRKLKAGDKVYAVNRGKMLVLVQLGRKELSEGLNILGAHIDSPRLDFKPHPFYEDSSLAMAKTHYYGGIKKFQWVTLPLALHGIIVKKDGESVKVCIGEDPSDPVFTITDVLPHFGGEQAKKPVGEAFTGEDLNLCIGSEPLYVEDENEKELVKKNVLHILKQKYDVDEDDFESAEIEVVPAGAARDMGFDRSMVLAYGQDDKICAYTSFEAQMDMDKEIGERTFVTLLVDKEEIGSVGATGMHSHFFEDVMAEILEMAEGFDSLKMRRMLHNSKMLSSDVSVAFDPNYPNIQDKNNGAFLSYGPSLNKYTGARGKSGSNDATPEYIAHLRRIFDEADVHYQISELGKVDMGGGGTIAYILAQYAMDVIDMGIPLFSMHSPWEVSGKPDIYEAYRAYKVFLGQMD